eukprot:CAMPEP_0201270600 /NCGR_PEP_ID=MMETSP0853-20130426/36044_1 /ASSEMBLY_ACC=CAM_ASM_000640 /TAXON_ID=183588 /ORGANISM="Pseudo-nitzschia fraudulenta, Strain WWA7" /LENGTH=58 /DNA_ID=CAMNT_0047576927 /DNA_START=66 /DNA_END=239 /DNA_ORIENTATION=-
MNYLDDSDGIIDKEIPSSDDVVEVSSSQERRGCKRRLEGATSSEVAVSEEDSLVTKSL